MTWAEAILKMLGEIITASFWFGVFLAICTDFWERLFDKIFGEDCDDDEE